MAQKKQPVSFRKVIAPSTSGYMDYIVPADGTVEEVKLYFAQGQTFDLQINAAIIQAGSEAPTPIILYADNTDNFISGDDIQINYQCSRPLTIYDKIRIYYNNTDAVNSLNLSVDVVIDYYGDRQRVV